MDPFEKELAEAYIKAFEESLWTEAEKLRLRYDQYQVYKNLKAALGGP